MRTMVAGAFDVFSHAKAAADDLQASGFAREWVQITSNPRNPDRMPAGSLFAKACAFPIVLEGLLSNLLDFGDEAHSNRAHRDDVIRGGVVVTVPVDGNGERILAENILRMHCGIEIDHQAGGLPLY